MKSNKLMPTLTLAAAFVALAAAGCGKSWRAHYQRPTMAPLGSVSDSIWMDQERHAEMSDFVIYEHEFEMDGIRLNGHGEDHVKQIAARLLQGQNAPVVVQRSRNSARADTEYQYPVHPDPELDMKRRDIIVRLLTAMSVADAEERVVVSPAYSPGIKVEEAEASNRGGGYRSGNRGFGGFFFGGGNMF